MTASRDCPSGERFDPTENKCLSEETEEETAAQSPSGRTAEGGKAAEPKTETGTPANGEGAGPGSIPAEYPLQKMM